LKEFRIKGNSCPSGPHGRGQRGQLPPAYASFVRTHTQEPVLATVDAVRINKKGETAPCI